MLLSGYADLTFNGNPIASLLEAWIGVLALKAWKFTSVASFHAQTSSWSAFLLSEGTVSNWLRMKTTRAMGKS